MNPEQQGTAEEPMPHVSSELDSQRTRKTDVENADAVSEGGTLPSGVEASPLPRGSALGRYLVLGCLGRGGMGVVYAAYDPELDRKIALKLLRPDKAGRLRSLESRSRLIREAQAMARLSHPNVISVYDVGTFGEQVFIAMEYVAGQTLSRWLKEKERPLKDTLRVFSEAGHGLATAHGAGLVHRDFKPDNVLVGRDGQVKVLDFGLARAAEGGEEHSPTLPAELGAHGGITPRQLETSLTRSGAFLGTPRYMAPEQLLGKGTAPRTDQFSFCVALYEALYGERPFAGEDLKALATEITSGSIRQPNKSKRVPSWLRQAVLRGLRPNPEDRFTSMDALLQRLDRNPRVFQIRALMLGAAVLALATAAFAYRETAHRQAQVCKGAEQRLAGIWDEEKKRAVAAALLATQASYAVTTAQSVDRALSAYARAWVKMQTDACEATRVRGEQPEELLDLRTECLSERREELSRLVDIFLRADSSVVEKAGLAARSLTSLDRCADAVALRAPIHLPKDHSKREKVEEVRKKLGAVKALKGTGKYSEAFSVAVLAADEARAIQYRPLEAEALVELGALQNIKADAKGAEQTFREAILSAQAGRHDVALAHAWIHLVAVGLQAGKYAESLEWSKHAFALLERLGDSDGPRSSLLLNVGNVLLKQGKLDEALEHHQRSLAIQERLLGSEDPRIAATLNGIGGVFFMQLKFDQAREMFQRGLDILERAVGPSHPYLTRTLNNLGATAMAREKYRDGLAYYQRALVIDEGALGPKHPHLGFALTGIGRSHLGLNAPLEAISPLERALILREPQPADPMELAETRFALARALAETKQDPRRARLLAVKARDVYATRGKQPELDTVNAFIRKTR